MQKQQVIDYIDEIAPALVDASEKLWDYAELANQEKQSADFMRGILRANGFAIVEIPGMPTAFYAGYGAGAPTLAILGEYDALPGLSQTKGSKQQPLNENAPGHGCGHNLLGTGALGAALALKKYLQEAGASGTVRFYGCPAEETLSGKPEMILRRAFDGCDVALSWHPMNANAPFTQAFLANESLRFYFRGKTAHAAFAPHLGRSALDAVELMNVGANYLREHVMEQARIHYTTNSGGFPPNIVPDYADAWYYVRAPHMSDVLEIVERLKDVARGAALMTGTSVEFKTISGCCEMLPNKTMEKLTRANMEQIPRPAYTKEEERFASELLATISPEQIKKDWTAYGYTVDSAPLLVRDIASYEIVDRTGLRGSSDSGDVSYLMPMNLFTATCAPLGTTVHTWQITASSGNSIGQKGMLYAAKVLSAVGYDLFVDKAVLRQAVDEFTAVSLENPYIPVIPD